MARFTLPRDLYHGKGALEALKDFEGKRAMICVGGGSMKRFGFLDRAKQYLEESGVDPASVKFSIICSDDTKKRAAEVIQANLKEIGINVTLNIMEMAAWQEKWASYLDGKKELHILSKDTDIFVNVAGRKWINCCGDANFPDGEIFTSPVEDGINGYITFSYPAIMNGNEFYEVRLTVENPPGGRGRPQKAAGIRAAGYGLSSDRAGCGSAL